MDDDGDIIAEAIVALLNGQSYSMKFSAVAPDDPDAIQLDATEGGHEGIKCFVLPVAKTVARYDRQAVALRTTVNIFVSRFLDDGTTRRKMSKLAREIENSLRLQKMAERYQWDSAEVVTLYDPEKLQIQTRFLSVFSVTYLDVQ